jgi:hypothetical protein
MRYSSFQVINYKSYIDSQEVKLSPGYNIIVGQNNSGKTALAQALSLKLTINPHRSLITVPYPNAPLRSPVSSVRISFEIGSDELRRLLSDQIPNFYIPVLPQQANMSDQQIADEFNRVIQRQVHINCEYSPGIQGFTSAYPVEYGDIEGDFNANCAQLRVSVDRSEAVFKVVPLPGGRLGQAKQQTIAFQIASAFKNKIYCFAAERLNVHEYTIGGISPELAGNASNLAACLLLLQSTNPSRFKRLNVLLHTVIPDITCVTVSPTGNNTARILVWTIPPESERDDLAMPLSECGTGIGQVLAILYVVITANDPRVIIIDEPQTFLHPGAVRKLFDILKQYPQHQYIITTHSPTAVMAAEPKRLLLVRKVDSQSTVDSIDVEETQQLRIYLSEIGARLSDVFGADNILCVEGQTEELCFPLIFQEVAKRQLMGTAIIGVVQTGDLEAKGARRIVDIYTRLCSGRGLLPPAVGFIFDTEGRSQTEQDDLKRQSRGLIHFTPRRMFENYLFNPEAIAFVITSIADFRDQLVVAAEVAEWIEQHRWNSRYVAVSADPKEESMPYWLEHVHGARLLDDMFKELSQNRVTYDKVIYGVALTKWIIEHNPEQLQAIADLINTVIPQV